MCRSFLWDLYGRDEKHDTGAVGVADRRSFCQLFNKKRCTQQRSKKLLSGLARQTHAASWPQITSHLSSRPSLSTLVFFFLNQQVIITQMETLQQIWWYCLDADPLVDIQNKFPFFKTQLDKLSAHQNDEMLLSNKWWWCFHGITVIKPRKNAFFMFSDSRESLRRWRVPHLVRHPSNFTAKKMSAKQTCGL